MDINLETARLLEKLARGKGNWGAKMDRLEHYNRFPNLKSIVKQLVNMKWLLSKKKPSYQLISLNTIYKKEIYEFIKKEIRDSEGYLK